MLAQTGDMAEPPKQQFNVYLKPDLIRRIKYLALDEQKSLSQVVEEALEAHLANAKEKPQ